MIKIFESFNEEFELSEEAYLFIEQNPILSMKQIDDFFLSKYQNFTVKDTYDIFEVYNSILNVQVQKHLIEKAYQFFIDKVSQMLESKMYSGIQTLLDLFWHNWEEINWSDIERNIKFLDNTYPLLFCKDDFADIASRFYWDLVSKDYRYTGENIKLKQEFKEKFPDRYNELFPFGEKR